ncbi:Beta-barrel assembly machine subunit BamA [Solimonas aquatica]|uniref:Outer membrane protein assembly factor BamA n=1 Tax=Solimonas aquatica TaxID=489703 RepID=A0A1H9AJK2_9GAMM|nr:outer membrane protein assembly factor BamA [Solimonas aquatica]SEP76936.1 Beta-barrel assembly machine subunit BamA [Solimonas aquatica]
MNRLKLSKTAIAATLAALAFHAHAQDDAERFTIKEIRAEGLQRLEIGTVLTYMPLAAGDELNPGTAKQAIRALYGSGLFQDVQLLHDGDTLIIKVQERPAISTFKIEGNDKIGGDELKKSLKNMGLADGELFRRDLLDGVEQELRRQYYANGYYDVGIESKVTEEPNNRVSINIKVTEGTVTKITNINIIGNKVFSTDELLKQFDLKETNWVPFQRSDRYSKQSLSGDLEKLQSYYQDRGYLKFSVDSVQVQLTPDKKSIYITINITEGDVYKVKTRRYSGNTILNERYLEVLTSTPDGSTFSRKQATESADRIEAALADIGFAFAKVTPVPEVDEDKREVTLNYAVDPGKRAYVRHILFTGNTGTNDETLRREMRQLEAAPFSKSAVERSRVRLSRLPFIENAEVDTKPVPGTDDQVDVSFKVKERPPGSVQFGVGYSGSYGFLITGQVTHTNFLGTGNRLDLSAENNTVAKSLNLSWSDPYFTEDGISQTASLFYRTSKSVIRYSSGFDTNTIGFNLTYGIPLSEYVALRAGFGVQDIAVQTYANSTSDQILNFVVENGTQFFTYELRTGISYDTRNRTFFATRGALHSLSADVALPGGDLQYYNVSYRGQQYVPLIWKFTLEMNASVGVVDAYGATNVVPPFENFFAGGPRTVRGYRDGSLGPRDTPFNNPYGGKLRTTGQTNLIIPLPIESDGKSTRLEAFWDIGNVFAEPQDFSTHDLRQSAGIAFSWFTPFLGLLDLSYSFPLNSQFEDRKDRFQITFGSGF